MSKDGEAEVPMPPDPETCRCRMDVTGVAWAMIRLKLREADVLEGLTEVSWLDRLEHLLSDEVWGAVVKTSDGASFSKPSWSTVLELLQACGTPGQHHRDYSA